MLIELFQPQLQQAIVAISSLECLNGATYYTSNLIILVVRAMFPNKLISRGSAYPWPSSNPELIPPDFFNHP